MVEQEKSSERQTKINIVAIVASVIALAASVVSAIITSGLISNLVLLTQNAK